jgi:16S rRNA (cytidine1402-2'-O)-methyltransferase
MGTLVLITLPIGNLDDITLRALSALKEPGHFLCEDTRTFKQLLSKLDIPLTGKKITSFHDQSTPDKLSRVLNEFSSEECLYLVSEAGSPVISDPAYPLIRAAVDGGHQVTSLPGATAPTTALELSALPPLPHTFHGFLPRERGKRVEQFHTWEESAGTHIFFEAPSRVVATVELLADTLPQSQVVITRELTKKFESVHRFVAIDFDQIKEQIVLKGEFTILLYIRPEDRKRIPFDLHSMAVDFLAGEAQGKKQLAKILAKIVERPVKEIYKELC